MTKEQNSLLASKKIKKIIKILDNRYGKISPFLVHKNIYELLICVILSAQTTDAGVNKVSLNFFSKFPSIDSLAEAKISEVENLLKSINYYKTKSRNIIETAKIIKNDFGNQVPNKMDDLLRLKGVGRKVANVILADGFGQEIGIVVDTHVKRVTYRLGWTNSKDPEKIEKDLLNIIPKNKWINLPKQLILIGRNYCKPQKPICDQCPLAELCIKRVY